MTRTNVDLANDLGNLAQRTLSLIARNCEGRLPGRGAATEADAALLSAAEALPGCCASIWTDRCSTKGWKRSGK